MTGCKREEVGLDRSRHYLPARACSKDGKLGAPIVQSLRENAKAGLEVASTPGKGTRVTIVFSRSAAAPEQKVEPRGLT